MSAARIRQSSGGSSSCRSRSGPASRRTHRREPRGRPRRRRRRRRTASSLLRASPRQRMTVPSTARPQDSPTRKCSRTGPGAPRKPRSRFDGSGSRTRVTAERRPGAVGVPRRPRWPADCGPPSSHVKRRGRLSRTWRRTAEGNGANWSPCHRTETQPSPTGHLSRRQALAMIERSPARFRIRKHVGRPCWRRQT
jgi:hypothetical protein